MTTEAIRDVNNEIENHLIELSKTELGSDRYRELLSELEKLIAISRDENKVGIEDKKAENEKEKNRLEAGNTALKTVAETATKAAGIAAVLKLSYYLMNQENLGEFITSKATMFLTPLVSKIIR